MPRYHIPSSSSSSSSPWTTPRGSSRSNGSNHGTTTSAAGGRWMSNTNTTTGGQNGDVVLHHRLTTTTNTTNTTTNGSSSLSLLWFVIETTRMRTTTTTTIPTTTNNTTIRTELPMDLQESLSLAIRDHHHSSSSSSGSSSSSNGVMELLVLYDDDDDQEEAAPESIDSEPDQHHHHHHHRERESVLLLYTSHNVYMVTIAYHHCRHSDSNPITAGRIVSVREPLDRYGSLLDDSSTIICRIRRPPDTENHSNDNNDNNGRSSSSSNTVVVAPPGSFAVLVQHTETNEYQLWLCQVDVPLRHDPHHPEHHHKYNDDNDATVSMPLQFQLVDSEARLTDFCFAATASSTCTSGSSSSSSSSNSLWTSLSILLLNDAGDIYSASPILWDQSIVTRTVLDDCLAVLQERGETLSQNDDDDGAEWRRCKAAHQYLLDVFLSDAHFHHRRRRQFCTAQLRQAPERSAARWPTKLQGPLIRSPTNQDHDDDDDDSSPRAMAIEPFGPTSSTGSSEWMVGVAIAKTLGKVDFCCLSPTTLLPRFAFESRNDALELDDALIGLAALVERVDVCPTDAEEEPSIVPSSSRMIHLVRDPIVHHLLHYATSSAVYTISTNVMRIISHQLMGLPLPVDPIRTTAWVNLRTVGDEPIQGMVVVADAGAGHCLYVGLPHDVATINVAEASYLHEFDTLFLRPVTATDATDPTPNSVLLLENNDTPLFSDLQPLVETIQAGLSNMGRFVGSETKHRDIAPDLLAVVIQTKKRCDEEIVVPLLELKKILEQHRAKITASLAEQERQLREARDTIQQIQARMTPIGERLETAKANAMALSERGIAVLQTSQKLLPTITQAEYEFFQMIQRMNIKCTQLEAQVRKLNDLVVARCDTFDAAAIAESLTRMDQDGNTEQINALLSFENQQLQAIQTRLTDTDRLTRNVMKDMGMNHSTRYPALFNIKEATIL